MGSVQMKINKMDLIHSFKAMMMVAQEYNVPVPPQFDELNTKLLLEHDLTVYDILGSMAHIYEELKDKT